MNPVRGALILSCLFAGPVPAQSTDCARLGLDSAEKRVALTARISNLDVDALRLAQTGVECFRNSEYAELGQASGTYFDARPREYLQNISARDGKDVSLLDALAFLPDAIQRDPEASMEAYARRGSLLDANADLINPYKHKHIVESLWRGMDKRTVVLAESLPEPDTLIEPLVGLEINFKGGPSDPVPYDFMTFEDLASIVHWYGAGKYWAPGKKIYVILSGYRLSADGLEADPGWIEFVDESSPRARVEKLGSVNPVLASGLIPPEGAANLCAAGVKQLEYAFNLDHERLQAALDAHIAKHPDASLAQPLLDAFRKAGYKVKKYRVLSAPPATQVSRSSSSEP